MDQFTSGSGQYQSGQDQNAGVWPPPPTNQASTFGQAAPVALTFPFKTLFFYVKPSSVPNFRVGTVALYPEGISIQGKAVTRYENQVSILIISLFLRLFLVAYLIMEYAIRRDEMVNVPWASVQEVALVPKKRYICLVYSAPNYKGVVKKFSLTFRPEPAYYAAFVENIQTFLPGRVTEGQLRRWTSPPVRVFCGGLLVVLIFLGILFATSPQSLGNLR